MIAILPACRAGNINITGKFLTKKLGLGLRNMQKLVHLGKFTKPACQMIPQPKWFVV